MIGWTWSGVRMVGRVHHAKQHILGQVIEVNWFTLVFKIAYFHSIFLQTSSLVVLIFLCISITSVLTIAIISIFSQHLVLIVLCVSFISKINHLKLPRLLGLLLCSQTVETD